MNDFQLLAGVSVFLIAILLELVYWIILAEKVVVMEGFSVIYRWKYMGTKGKERVILYFIILLMYFITCVHA